jgi:hypothetical protein
MSIISSQFSFSQNKEKDLLKKLEFDWLMAEFAVDTSAISKLMDRSFISIGPSGTNNKQQELAGIYKNMHQRQLDNHIVDSLYFNDLSINLYDNTAVVTFVSVTKGRKNNISYANRRTRMYDVWIKRNGQWKAVSSQVTPLH